MHQDGRRRNGTERWTRNHQGREDWRIDWRDMGDSFDGTNKGYHADLIVEWVSQETRATSAPHPVLAGRTSKFIHLTRRGYFVLIITFSRKKRKFELGRQPAMTKLDSSKRVHEVRVRGGNTKYRALRLDTGNFAWGSETITRKTRLIQVVSYSHSRRYQEYFGILRILLKEEGKILKKVR